MRTYLTQLHFGSICVELSSVADSISWVNREASSFHMHSVRSPNLHHHLRWSMDIDVPCGVSVTYTYHAHTFLQKTYQNFTEDDQVRFQWHIRWGESSDFYKSLAAFAELIFSFQGFSEKIQATMYFFRDFSYARHLKFVSAKS